MVERRQRGHVLWLLLLMLGLLAELALASLQMAARTGLSLQAMEAGLQQDARAEAIAAAVAGLPVPAAASHELPSPPWHPLTAEGAVQTACAGAGPESYVALTENCSGTDGLQSPGWSWQLARVTALSGGGSDGSDDQAFPGLFRQQWQLRVQVRDRRSRQDRDWLFLYRQLALP